MRFFHFTQAHATTGNVRYIRKLISPVFSVDNFARIDAELEEVRVSFFERKGDRLGQNIKLPL